ncbi:MAG: hypothetical protein K2W94_08345 [Alphaproteobacteria bacterium]|nr:hypothetical protein [Alphaproteobacteria bacterium]
MKTNHISCLLIVFISLIKLIMIGEKAEAAAAVPIKMGIELELQEITYVNEAEVVLQDHIRLFESESRGEGGIPDWYLEVDGTGNLEFVTRPFLLSEASERDCLLRSTDGIHQLSAYILERSRNPISLDGSYTFVIEKGTTLAGLGQWILGWDDKNLLPQEVERLRKQKNITISIDDPTFKVRPQATFEFPYSLMPNFAHYMAAKHSKLSSAVQKVDAKGKLPGLTANDYGFHYLIMLYGELLKEKRPGSELGPKAHLTLMSRKSFSSYVVDRAESWDHLLSTVGPDARLFGTYYNIYFNDKNLADEGEVRAILDFVTMHKWIESMRNPGIAAALSPMVGEIWEKVARESLSRDRDNVPAQIILKQLREGLFSSHEDLLSPPLFVNKAYSMGKYTAKDKHAVVEMRGYTAAYSNNMRMGQMIRSWLEREMRNALGHWAPGSVHPISDYERVAEGIKGEIEVAPWQKKQNALTDSVAMIRAPLKIRKFAGDPFTITGSLESNLDRYRKSTEKEFFECNKGIIEEINVQQKAFGLHLLR